MGLFQHPAYLLWALLAALACAALAAWSESRRRRLLEAFARPQTLRRLYDESAVEVRRLRTWLEAGALCLLFAALAGPQWGVELVETRDPGSQAVIVVDTSLSMLCEDIKPSRMEKAKNALSLLIDGLQGSRVGIVAFAGEAYVQCPLTTDLEAAKSFLRRVQVGLVPQAGTDLSKAILAARAMLERASGDKSILLLSDGETLAGDPQQAAADAAQAGIRIFLIGTGTPEGEPIPLKDGEGRLLGYKKGPDGQTVVSKLNEQGMMEIAAASGGAYYRATQSEEEVGKILQQMKGADSDGNGSGKGTSTRMRNRYRLPLLAAVLLLLVELFLMEGARTKLTPPPAALAAAALLLVAWSPKKDAKLWKGNKSYQQGRYEEAFEQYARALKKGDKDPKPLFNAGDALFKMGEFDKAAESFKRLIDPRFNTRRTAADANFNLGNALARKGQGAEAADAYRRCLLLDMDDAACRHNLALLLQNPPPPQKQDEQKQDQKDKGGGGGGQDKKKSPPKQQPQQKKPQEQKGGMTKEDAERILQAIKERERQAKPMPVQPQDGKDEKPGEDW
ncbi:MAG TPA: hypothetical protein DCM05_11835 [Elusimicrobia bacterium]|nr:hypothetical protein [Elusimicrobiota bacterium]